MTDATIGHAEQTIMLPSCVRPKLDFLFSRLSDLGLSDDVLISNCALELQCFVVRNDYGVVIYDESGYRGDLLRAYQGIQTGIPANSNGPEVELVFLESTESYHWSSQMDDWENRQTRTVVILTAIDLLWAGINIMGHGAYDVAIVSVDEQEMRVVISLEEWLANYIEQ